MIIKVQRVEYDMDRDEFEFSSDPFLLNLNCFEAIYLEHEETGRGPCFRTFPGISGIGFRFVVVGELPKELSELL